MALDFPNSPTIGDEFTGGGFTWTWSGTAWEKVTAAGSVDGKNFTLSVGASGNTTYNFTTPLAAGNYTVQSQLGDSTFDIYLITSDNENAGYTATGSLTATAAFDKLVVYGATPNDVFSFTYTLSSSPTANGNLSSGAAPFLASATPTTLESINDTTTVQGGNFANNVQISFVGTDSVSRSAKSIVRSSSTQLIVTRPDTFPVSAEPFSMIATNPGITNPSTNANRLLNYFDAGGAITWSTGATLPEYSPGTAYSTTLVATDADGLSLTYSVTSGSLPSGLALSSSGVISGTPGTSGNASFTVTATDSGNNTASRAFTMNQALIFASGGTITNVGGFRYHTFNASGTFTVTANATNTQAQYLVVAGGGGSQAFNASSGDAASGGGGAGGYRALTTVPTAGSYPVVVGAGGNGVNGSNSSIFSNTATGGGSGGGGGNGSGNGNGGGSGGSGGGTGSFAGSNVAGTGTAGQGNNGAYSNNRAFGAGGGGAGGTPTNTVNGGVGLQWLNGNFYAGGGGAGGGIGSGWGSPGVGGTGGGGNGGGVVTEAYMIVYGGNGGTNTGGGAGGSDAAYSAPESLSGGSGTVIVRYPLV
jgi:hypothetical protein